jgi:glycerate 2-kinase
MKSSLRYDPEKRAFEVAGEIYCGIDRIFVIGGGKASGLMAQSLEEIIGADNITSGIVNCKSGGYKTKRIKIVRAGHPLPDKKGLDGIKQMLAMKERFAINKGDLVICLISGGGSALMPCPADSLSLEDQQKTTQLLLSSGADIHEINSVRKHLSRIKGGRLGEYYSPVMIVSLIISDVIGDNLDVIASGPTHPDSSTYRDALDVLRKYDLTNRVPPKGLTYLESGDRGEVPETPKKLTNCHNHIIGSNRLALKAMAEEAKVLGFNPIIDTAAMQGDTGKEANQMAGEILAGKYAGYDAILLGGETTPTLPDNPGEGGRNQHYAAVSMLAMKSYLGYWVTASAGTDGSDYLPDVAGAIVDNETLLKATAKGIDVREYINRFDSNTLFRKIGGSLIITGNTGTNVSDVIVYLLQ